MLSIYSENDQIIFCPWQLAAMHNFKVMLLSLFGTKDYNSFYYNIANFTYCWW